MVTMVGTESTLDSLLKDLAQLDHDAADAYQAAIDRLENAGWRQTLQQFKEDHLRHTREIGDLLQDMGREPPESGDMKSILTKGKVAIGSLAGDTAILEAMRSNEADTNTAYERAVEFKDLSAKVRDVLERGRDDERRHCDWMLKQLGRS